MLRWAHLLVERELGPDAHFGDVLEVGAGTRIHLSFVQHNFDRYVMAKVSRATLQRAEIDDAHWGKVELKVADAAALAFPHHSFDKVLLPRMCSSICQPVTTSYASGAVRRVRSECCRSFFPAIQVLHGVSAAVSGLAKRRQLRALIAMAREHVNTCPKTAEAK